MWVGVSLEFTVWFHECMGKNYEKGQCRRYKGRKLSNDIPEHIEKRKWWERKKTGSSITIVVIVAVVVVVVPYWLAQDNSCYYLPLL